MSSADFLNFNQKLFLLSGVANKKSIAYFVAQLIQKHGGKIIFTVQNEANKKACQQLFPDDLIFIHDVNHHHSMTELKNYLSNHQLKLDGFLHSMAFANYSEGFKPFHETKRDDFLNAAQISAFSLVEMCGDLKDFFNHRASVVTISISNTKATNYGYLGPIKAMLESVTHFLAKSFASFSEVRFNTVAAGPLKTSASAGIPGYIDAYLFSEQMTLRHSALKTQEVANSIVFLLSNASSGINASTLLIDAGMAVNAFDEEIIKRYSKFFDEKK